MRRIGIRHGQIETSVSNCRMCPAYIAGICPDQKISGASCSEGSVRQFVVESGQAVPLCAPNWNEIAVLKSGLVRLQTFTLQGRRHIVSLVLPGEILSSQQLRGMTQESVTKSVVCVVDKTLQVARAGFAMELYKQKAIQLERFRFMTCFIGVLTAEERICAFLAMGLRVIPVKYNPDGSLQISMLLGRIDLADLLGTTPETISRVTHKLQNENILVINDANDFSILDLARLVARGKMSRPEISANVRRMFGGTLMACGL